MMTTEIQGYGTNMKPLTKHFVKDPNTKFMQFVELLTSRAIPFKVFYVDKSISVEFELPNTDYDLNFVTALLQS